MSLLGIFTFPTLLSSSPGKEVEWGRVCPSCIHSFQDQRELNMEDTKLEPSELEDGRSENTLKSKPAGNGTMNYYMRIRSRGADVLSALEPQKLGWRAEAGR